MDNGEKFWEEPEEQDGDEAQQVDAQVTHDEQAQGASDPVKTPFKHDLTGKTIVLSQKKKPQQKKVARKEKDLSNLSKSTSH
jgi:hypothetical protein